MSNRINLNVKYLSGNEFGGYVEADTIRVLKPAYSSDDRVLVTFSGSGDLLSGQLRITPDLLRSISRCVDAIARDGVSAVELKLE